ncbi:hypothetical protein [Streptomyces sp. NPDC059176]|uniref:hypothetical protein n=1 Tax=unclassified Streptomyces TaxID=2593676 RepID=UPI00367379E4
MAGGDLADGGKPLPSSAPTSASPTRPDRRCLVRSRLEQIQYRPDAITGCLTEAGLSFAPP